MPENVSDPYPQVPQPGRSADDPAPPRGNVTAAPAMLAAVLAFIAPTLNGKSWVPYARALLALVVIVVLIVGGAVVWHLVTR